MTISKTGVKNDKKKAWQIDEELEDYLRSLPKVELHVHLDGAFDPFFLKNDLDASGDYSCLPQEIQLPWEKNKLPIREMVRECKSSLAFHSMCTCRGKRSLDEMIKCFEIFIPIVRGNLTLLEKLAHDFVKRQADQNIIYTEVRYSPHLLAENGTMFLPPGHETTSLVDPLPVVDAVTRGLRAGEKDFGVTVNQILCCLSWRPDWADDVVTLAHERRRDGPCRVVGIDIAAGEQHFDNVEYRHLSEPHCEAFRRAKDLGISVTMHAGEVGGAENVRKAVEEYGAKRIGHGYRVIQDEALMEEMARQNVHFEICPTSSVETGGWDYDVVKGKNWKKHPAVIMHENNLKLSLNSDDPAVFDTSLTWQLRIATVKMGLKQDTITQMIYHAIDAAFITEAEKNELRALVKLGKVNERRSFREMVRM
eukprot:CAMPEP_0172489962 /NCGR_PEP_ID=MMETSP1066-20121228/20261_1 /TAXON_ID=671091 /ORGANISM="Coscinodiscus wailesii, Strain CCMP2513" /LENGTH=421 /DNA_ID=CAMNT_0013258201 /DNA_START=24 /DNA_END=1289 /DNA_ORIENTATION=-